MRWSTLVFSVTLFYSLSFVNAIPHDVHEKRHWLHRRQDNSGSSPAVPSVTGDPQGDPTPSDISPSSPPTTPRPSSRPVPSSTPKPPSSTPQPESSSSIISSSSSSIPTSQSSSSSSSSAGSSTPSSPSSANRPNRVPTSYHRFTSTNSLPSDTSSAGGESETGTGSGNSFLTNKAAVGSTFAIVGLIGVAIIVGAIFFMIKKARKRRDDDELDTYFEKLPANNNNDLSNQNFGGGNDYGLGPSAADLTTSANGQAYMSRDVHYGATNQYPNQYPAEYANYNGLEYPPERGSVVESRAPCIPGTAYAAAMGRRGQYQYEGQVENPNAVPNHPSADPNSRRY